MERGCVAVQALADTCYFYVLQNRIIKRHLLKHVDTGSCEERLHILEEFFHIFWMKTILEVHCEETAGTAYWQVIPESCTFFQSLSNLHVELADLLADAELADILVDVELADFLVDAEMADILVAVELADFLVDVELADFLVDAEMADFLVDVELADCPSDHALDFEKSS
ncbi:hypothetical protein EOD39_13668 [Acipenser ruthenus]|uniref:Uncharacterized protein n=1 Tax=Acipenser ruthenus TaxID=7906 RepID=A0A662YNL8_ACIRT|nr:hypothetical protein EOD39_13668 [Acipenser ruthenus]